jgi:Mg2+/Co2+ transporter CorC
MDEHNAYEVPGDMKLSDFNNLTNFGIADHRMTTIGGVAFRHFDRVPEVGDSVVVDGTTITVLDVDCHRIAKLRAAKGRIEPSREDASPDEPSGEDVNPDENASDLETSEPSDDSDQATTRENSQ